MKTEQLSELCNGGIWYCKIGETKGKLPMGSDAPMRMAVRKAYGEITGGEPSFIFSGWGAELTEPERAVVENRLPRMGYNADVLLAKLVDALDGSPAVSMGPAELKVAWINAATALGRIPTKGVDE